MIRLESDLDRYAVIGGDMRQVYLAKLLAQRGNKVRTYALIKAGTAVGAGSSAAEAAESLEEVLTEADIIAAPMPFFKAGAIFSQGNVPDLTPQGILRYAKPGSRIFAGGIPEEFTEQAKLKNIKCMDYMKNEAVAVENTAAAAEGLLAEAITRSPRNLFKSNCLILGYGRCGTTLASYLKGCFARIMIYECNEAAAARAKLAADEMVEAVQLKEYLTKADFIFNTVPSMVLPKAFLGYVREDALILDLASAPGGVDYKAAENMGLQAVLLPGLPGKYAPLSSARILADAIIREKNEKGK